MFNNVTHAEFVLFTHWLLALLYETSVACIELKKIRLGYATNKCAPRNAVCRSVVKYSYQRHIYWIYIPELA